MDDFFKIVNQIDTVFLEKLDYDDIGNNMHDITNQWDKFILDNNLYGFDDPSYDYLESFITYIIKHKFVLNILKFDLSKYSYNLFFYNFDDEPIFINTIVR